MHIVSFQKNSVFYNSYFKCIEQGVFRIERITFSRYYVVNLEEWEIVFKLLTSNCIAVQSFHMLSRYIIEIHLTLIHVNQSSFYILNDSYY